jgi:hypothetical protein
MVDHEVEKVFDIPGVAVQHCLLDRLAASL